MKRSPILLFVVTAIWLVLHATGSEHTLLPNQANTTFVIHQIAEAQGSGDITFNFASCQKIIQPLKLECLVYEQILHKNNSLTNERSCNITLTGGDNSEGNKDLKLLSLTKFSYRRSLLRWLEIEDDIVVNARYDVMQRVKCEVKGASFPIGLSQNDESYLNDFFASSASEIEIFVSSRIACEGREKCMIQMSRSSGTEVRDPLNFNLAYLRIYSTSVGGYPSINAGDHYIDGLDPITGMNRLFCILSAENGMLTALKTMEDISHGYVSKSQVNYFANCQAGKNTDAVNVTDDETEMFCATYVRDDILINNTFHIRDNVKLINIWFTNHSDNSILLVSEKDSCNGTDCWNLFVTMVYESKSAVTRRIQFDCDGERKNLAIAIHDKTNELVYGCEKMESGDRGMNRYFHVKKVVL